MRCNATLEIQELCDLILISIDEYCASVCSCIGIGGYGKEAILHRRFTFPGSVDAPPSSLTPTASTQQYHPIPSCHHGMMMMMETYERRWRAFCRVGTKKKELHSDMGFSIEARMYESALLNLFDTISRPINLPPKLLQKWRERREGIVGWMRSSSSSPPTMNIAVENW